MLGENESGIYSPAGAVGTQTMTALLYHNVTLESPVLNVWNESGTNHGRIGDSMTVRLRSLRYMALLTLCHTT
jgi:hypothetical protein